MALSARATSQPPEIAESSFRRPHETRRSGSLRGADEGEGARTLSQALQDSVAGIRIVDLGRTLAAGRWLRAERCLGGNPAAAVGEAKLLVPGTGLEPVLPFGKLILSQKRLPFRHPGVLKRIQ